MCIVLNIFKFGAVQFFEDTLSATIEAVVRLQPRCSEKIERDSGLISFTTRLLVPTSRIGCLIGKGGSIITEMRRLTKANIRILPKENLPKIASEDDEMVQVKSKLKPLHVYSEICPVYLASFLFLLPSSDRNIVNFL